MKSVAKTYDELPLSLNAEQVAQVLGISRAGAYNLLHSRGFPTVRIGHRLMVPKEKLFRWIDKQSSCLLKLQYFHETGTA